MELNNTQRLVSDISGYTPQETSARDDGYYAIDNSTERLIYLREYLKNVADYEVDVLDQCSAFDFLETEFENENMRYYSYRAL